jgi:hypothetical protein
MRLRPIFTKNQHLCQRKIGIQPIKYLKISCLSGLIPLAVWMDVLTGVHLFPLGGFISDAAILIMDLGGATYFGSLTVSSIRKLNNTLY